MYALVTGATSGIGLEIAKILAKMKYDLILVGRRSERLEQISSELINNYDIKIDTYTCDLSIIKKCKELLEYTNKYKDISVVINAAGFGKIGYAENSIENDDIEMIGTNVISLQMITNHFYKKMKEGNIVNIGSIAGVAPIPYMATYGATKAYVISYGMALNYELRKLKKNVFITTACPGPVDTEFDKVAGSKFKWKGMKATKCAEKIVKAMRKNRGLVMIGFKTKAAYLGLKLVPSCIALPIEFRLQTKKTGD